MERRNTKLVLLIVAALMLASNMYAMEKSEATSHAEKTIDYLKETVKLYTEVHFDHSLYSFKYKCGIPNANLKKQLKAILNNYIDLIKEFSDKDRKLGEGVPEKEVTPERMAHEHLYGQTLSAFAWTRKGKDRKELSKDPKFEKWFKERKEDCKNHLILIASKLKIISIELDEKITKTDYNLIQYYLQEVQDLSKKNKSCIRFVKKIDVDALLKSVRNK